MGIDRLDHVLAALNEVIARFKRERATDPVSKTLLSERALGKDRSTVSKWFSGTAYSRHDMERICDYMDRFAPGWAQPVRDAMSDVGGPDSSAFGDLWSALIGSKDLTIIEAAEIRKLHAGAPRVLHSEERNLVSQLRDALRDDKRTAKVKARLRVSDPSKPEVEDALYTDDTLLVGGPATNFQVRNFLNLIPHLRWVITYDMPHYQRARVLDRKEKVVRFAKYDDQGFPTEQWGVLTMLRNPARDSLTIVSAAGIHGEMTAAIVKLLLEGDLRVDSEEMELPFPRNARGFQVLYHFRVEGHDALEDMDRLTGSLESWVYQIPLKDPEFFKEPKNPPDM